MLRHKCLVALGNHTLTMGHQVWQRSVRLLPAEKVKGEARAASFITLHLDSCNCPHVHSSENLRSANQMILDIHPNIYWMKTSWYPPLRFGPPESLLKGSETVPLSLPGPIHIIVCPGIQMCCTKTTTDTCFSAAGIIRLSVKSQDDLFIITARETSHLTSVAWH